MKRYLFKHIETLSIACFSLADAVSGKDGIGPDEPLTPAQISKAKNGLKQLANKLRRLGLRFSPNRAKQIGKELGELGGSWAALSDFQQELEGLQKLIDKELESVTFGFIPPDGVPYFDKERLFGARVAESFPSARHDIKEAGNCYAHESYTACVFHLMRAVEHGARAMVRALKVRKHLTHPVELCDWAEIAGALEKGLVSVAVGRRKSVAISQKSEFFNHAVSQFRSFKDAWRNNVSHNRKIYLADETKDIMDITRQFMHHLAARLKE